jgi:hypothetical protein
MPGYLSVLFRSIRVERGPSVSKDGLPPTATASIPKADGPEGVSIPESFWLVSGWGRGVDWAVLCALGS